MPGAMHRMGVYLGLVEDEEFADGEGWDTPRENAREPVDRAPARRDSYPDSRYSRETKHEPARRGGVDTLSREYDEPDKYAGGYSDYQPAGYQITALHPRTYNEARTIGEAFRANTPVIMNLSEMDDADAKRLVDFAAGLTFGLHGRIERVTAKVFLLSPHNVTVTAQDKAKIENGFFNQS
ncbi:MAG: cell division protein SepF [Jatrophihabitantaceae bacterium]